jgi:hypothetical protein
LCIWNSQIDWVYNSLFIMATFVNNGWLKVLSNVPLQYQIGCYRILVQRTTREIKLVWWSFGRWYGRTGSHYHVISGKHYVHVLFSSWLPGHLYFTHSNNECDLEILFMDMHKLFIVSSATINFPLIKDWQLT